MIEFIDLKNQQARIKDKIDAGIQRVLRHGQYILARKSLSLRIASPISSALSTASVAPTVLTLYRLCRWPWVLAQVTK